jgi:spore germination protein KA
MPRAVGDAVGIVAGLILGDAAISAGITSAPVIMIASLTAVSSFIAPPFMNSLVFIRFLNIFAAKMFGFSGIMISVVFFAAELCKKQSFGVSYLTPFSPISKRLFADGVLVFPKKALSNTDTQIKKEKTIED